MNPPFENYWGIDVSKEWLDVDAGDKVIRVNQDKKSINAFIKKHTKIDNQKTLVVLESTGGYERTAVRCLSEADFTVHVAHPHKVKAFIQAKGRLAKTDKIDAKMLKEYARFIQPSEIRKVATVLQEKLESLSARLTQLKEMRHQESCRLGMVTDNFIKKSIKNTLSLFEKQSNEIQTMILDLITADSELKEKYTLLCSMKGIGVTTATILITDLPELGEISKKEIAALVGVAPITNISGQKTGKAVTKYGRFGVRKTLYMAALTASRYNPKLRDFYTKLIAAGKAPKVALVAVIRKMLVILNAMLQHKKPFYA